MRITKRELLDRLPPSSKVEELVVATARALGYEVVEEPELPERIDLCRLDELHGLAMPRGWLRPLPYTTDTEALTAELVLRYNAKAAVLAVAHDLLARACCPAILRDADALRAAYKAD